MEVDISALCRSKQDGVNELTLSILNTSLLFRPNWYPGLWLPLSVLYLHEIILKPQFLLILYVC